MKKPLFKMVVPSDSSLVQHIIHQVIYEIKKHGVALNLEGDSIRLVLDEAITNAMEHGNRWDSLKVISVSGYINGDSFNVCVVDEGSGFSNNDLPDYSKKIRKRGRGIEIIRKFCDISWNEKGNQAELVFQCVNKERRDECLYQKTPEIYTKQLFSF